MAIKPILVSKLNEYIKVLLESDGMLRSISVQGEVSNLTFHKSGHIYCSLKDEKSTLRCFIPLQYTQGLKEILKEGANVIFTGNINMYLLGGYYSLNVRDIEIEGVGALTLAFENIKQKLYQEGLFDVKYKKEIPIFPKKIAVVTSNTGAAIADIIRTITEKNNVVDIMVYPILVQGEKAKESIVEALEYINKNMQDDIDTIILGRGGGSQEDLWAFNEEVVARAIFASKIPIISAVGHEIDFTISDMVADLRALTPTDAGNKAVYSTEELRSKLKNLKDKSLSSLTNSIERKDYKLNLLKERLEGINPKNRIRKGYGAIINSEGKLLSSIENTKIGQELTIILSDGKIDVEVVKISDEEV